MRYTSRKRRLTMENISIKIPQYWQQNETLRQRPLKNMEMEIPGYSSSYGVVPVGSDGDYHLDVQIRGERHQEVTITADKEGLIVLARHLLTLAQDDVPSGCHIHYDEIAFSGFLDKGSCSMIVNKL